MLRKLREAENLKVNLQFVLIKITFFFLVFLVKSCKVARLVQKIELGKRHLSLVGFNGPFKVVVREERWLTGPQNSYIIHFEAVCVAKSGVAGKQSQRILMILSCFKRRSSPTSNLMVVSLLGATHFCIVLFMPDLRELDCQQPGPPLALVAWNLYQKLNENCLFFAYEGFNFLRNCSAASVGSETRNSNELIWVNWTKL